MPPAPFLALRSKNTRPFIHSKLNNTKRYEMKLDLVSGSVAISKKYARYKETLRHAALPSECFKKELAWINLLFQGAMVFLK